MDALGDARIRASRRRGLRPALRSRVGSGYSVPVPLIVAASVPVGSAGLMARIGPGGLEIGYWVHPASTGRGVGTAAAAALTEAALALPGIDHAEIRHDQLNLASGRVPAKLGYAHAETREGRFELAPGDSGKTEIWRITR